MAPPRGWRSANLLLLVVLLVHLVPSMRAQGSGTFTVNGVTYKISARLDTANNLGPLLTSSPWFGNQALAEAVATEVKLQLGFQPGFMPNDLLGAMFVYGPGNSVRSRMPSGNILPSVGLGATSIHLYAWAIVEASPSPTIPPTIPPDPSIEEWRAFDPVTNSVVWVPQAGLDCRVTCANTFMLAVSASKPTSTMPNPPLLCATIGALLNDPTLTVPGSLADDPYRFFLSEGYTQPTAADVAAGRPAEYDPRGCSSYLDGTTPNAQSYLCGCVPPRKSVNGAPQKPWRWVPANTDTCDSGDFTGYMAPFICRVRGTGLIGHLNTQNCGFPSAEEIPDCAFGQKNEQPASRFPAALNMPTAKPDFPDCVYATRTGVAGSTQETARWNNVDKLCVARSFRYFVYRWAKEGVRPSP